MIKLIVTDIDGTLVTDGGSGLNPEYYDVILKLRKKGIQFAAASGRQWCSIEKLFEPVKEKIFYLSDNGAYVGCHKRRLFINEMDRKVINELINETRKIKGLEILLSGPDMVYTDTANKEFITWMREGYRFNIESVPDLCLVNDKIIKLAICAMDNDIEEKTIPIIDRFKDRIKLTVSGSMWLDCMSLGVNKGNAVKLLQESLYIVPEETVVFGDQFNDIEMLERAYYSFAVGNAIPQTKKAARFMADSNINDGVLKILKLFLI